MGANSKIEWTHHTHNPWIGCSKVSDGCKFCYAENMMDHRYGRAQWGSGGTRVRTSAANLRKPYAWNKAAQASGQRQRVFCASLADVFEDRPELEPWRADLFKTIMDTPHLDWLLLTKRPENIRTMIKLAANQVARTDKDLFMWLCDWIFENRAPHNVWLGTSVEDQPAADTRIPELLRAPAQVRFLSMEPLLGPVDLEHTRNAGGESTFSKVNCLRRWTNGASSTGIDWVIVGGESGTGARPMSPSWALDIRDQCQAAGVPFFFKQGSQDNWKNYKDYENFPLALRVREVPEVHHANS